MSRRASRFYPSYRQLLVVLIVAIGIYVLLPQFGRFRDSWQLVRHPDPGHVAVAVLLTFATYVAAAGTYRFLAFRRLAFGQTILVQLAGMFVNRLLPAGLGAVGVNYLYLRQRRHTKTQAAIVVGINNLIGFIGHSLLLLCALLFAGEMLDRPVEHLADHTLAIGIAAAAVMLATVLAILYGRERTARLLRDVRKQLFSYRERPGSLIGALGTSILLTGSNVLCLAVCLHALSLSLPLSVVLIVFTFGVGVGAAVPTPGGLGGFEAGLAAGFVAYGIEPSQALAAAILYRLISYWLPMVAGLASFLIGERQGLFNPAAS